MPRYLPVDYDPFNEDPPAGPVPPPPRPVSLVPVDYDPFAQESVPQHAQPYGPPHPAIGPAPTFLDNADFTRGVLMGAQQLPQSAAGTAKVLGYETGLIPGGDQPVIPPPQNTGGIKPKFGGFGPAFRQGKGFGGKVKNIIDQIQETLGSTIAPFIPGIALGAAGGIAGTAAGGKIAGAPGAHIGGVAGTAAGAFGGSELQQPGDFYQAMEQVAAEYNAKNPNEKPLTYKEISDQALKYGTAAAILDAYNPGKAVKGVARELTQDVIKKSALNRINKYLQETGRTALTEASTEEIQQATQEVGTKRLTGDKVMTPTAATAILEAGAGGLIGGAGLHTGAEAAAAVGRALPKPAPPPAPIPQVEEKPRIPPVVVQPPEQPVEKPENIPQITVEETPAESPPVLPPANTAPAQVGKTTPISPVPAEPPATAAPIDSRETLEEPVLTPPPEQPAEPPASSASVEEKQDDSQAEDLPAGYHTIDMVDRFKPHQAFVPVKGMESDEGISSQKSVYANAKIITDGHLMIDREGNEDMIPAGKVTQPSADKARRFTEVLDLVRGYNQPEFTFEPVAAYDSALLGQRPGEVVDDRQAVYGMLGEKIIAVPPRAYDVLIRQKGYEIRGKTADHPLGIYKGDQLIGAIMPYGKDKYHSDEVDAAIKALRGRITPEQARQNKPGKPLTVAVKPTATGKGMTAGQRGAAAQTKEEFINRLKEIRARAAAAVEEGKDDYNGGKPEQVTLKTASGRETKYKITSGSREAVKTIDNLIAEFKGKRAEVFASRNPARGGEDKSVLPEREVIKDADDSEGGTPAETPAEIKPRATMTPEEIKQHAPRRIVNGRELEDFSVQNKPSFRRQMFAAMGLDPDAAVNMAPRAIVQRARTLFKDRFNIEIDVADNANFGMAVDNLLDAWVTFDFFARGLGIPPKAIGLKQLKTNAEGVVVPSTVTLQFTRDNRAALGSFNAMDRTIAIPGRSNSFSHEWGHALDYHVLEAMGRTRDGMNRAFRGYSSKIRREGADFSPGSVEEAWVNVMNSIFFDESFAAAKIMELEQKLERARSEKSKEHIREQIEKVQAGNYAGRDYRSEYFKGAARIPAGGDKDYWKRPTEMLARAFEAYVAYKVEALGGSTEMLSKGSDAYLNDADARIANIYPQMQERLRIFRAFDQMMNAVSTAAIIERGDIQNIEALPSSDIKSWEYMPIVQEKPSLVAAVKQAFSRERAEMAKVEAAAQKQARTSRPKDPRSVLDHWNEIRLYWTSAANASMRMMLARYPDSPSLQKMVRPFSKRYGSGEARQPTYRETQRMVHKRYSNILVAIEKKYKIKRSRVSEQRAMASLLQGLPVDQEIAGERMAQLKKAAAEIREGVYKKLYYDERAAGIDVGYVSDVGYMNQVFDNAVLAADVKKSKEILTEAYAVALEKEYEEDFDLESFLSDAAILGRDPRLKMLRQRLEEGGGEETTASDDLASELIPDVIALLAPVKAERLLQARIASREAEIDHVSGTGLRKGRSFPPETIKILAPLRINSASEAAQIYINSASRAIALHKAFPPEKAGQTPREVLNELLRRAVIEEGVFADDADFMHSTVLEMAGQANNKFGTSGSRKIANWWRTLMSIRLLDRSVFASLSESNVLAMRTGRVRDAYKSMYHTIRAAFNAGDMADIRKQLQYAGIVSDKMADIAATELYGGSYEMDPMSEKLSSLFYENNLVGPLTRAQQVGAAVTAAGHLRYLASSVTDAKTKKKTKDRNANELRDHTITDIEGFAEYVASLDDIFPAMNDDSPRAQMFWNAINSIVTSVVQVPSAETRPLAAAAGRNPMLYAIMGFNFSYFEHVIKTYPSYIEAEMKINGGKMTPALAHTIARFSLPYLNYVLWTSIAFLLRTLAFDKERFDEKELEEKFFYILKGGVAYTTPLGPIADLLYSAWTGLKYQRDITSLTAGAAIGSVLQDAQNIAQYFSRNSDKTGAAERNAFKAFYDLTIGSLSAMATGMISGIPGRVMGVANMFTGSKQTAGALAKQVFPETEYEKKRRESAERKKEREKENQ